MKPKEIFEVCHRRYKTMRGFLNGHVAALDWERSSEPYHWRPERARAEEYIADFERIAERALRRPEWRGRLKLFRIYFLRGFEYRRAITLCGVSPSTFDYWMAEVKKICGRAFARAGLFPPGDYFRKRGMACVQAAAAADTEEFKGRTDRQRWNGKEKRRPEESRPEEITLEV
jgi:hypothetical protein